ncbi:MAG: hypothetical protein ABIG95_01220 [Candidatus Woesearchaeota archaeon]
MESVEVWMWLIAGVILGGIIFTSAFVFLTKNAYSMEVRQADESFDSLKSAIDLACMGGQFHQDIATYVFPTMTNKVYIRDQNNIKGEGDYLCIQVASEQPRCEQFAVCTAKMQTVDMQQKTGAFYFIQKTMGRTQPTKLRFTISKAEKGKLSVTWEKTL